MEYNKDYYYYSRPDGRFYKIQLLSVDKAMYSFQIFEAVHNGWMGSSKPELKAGTLFEKHEHFLSDIFDNKDYLIIKCMVDITISGPYFENATQKMFYKELEDLFNQYPEQYITFVDNNLINTINYQFNIL